jgi:hypothetical protein
MDHVRLSLAPLLVAALLLPGRAGAALCDGDMPVSFVYPPGGQIEVPLNTRIWVGEAWTDDGSTLSVRRYEGETIEVTETSLLAGDREVTVLTPVVELDHDAFQTVATRIDGSEVVLATFATGYLPDTTPPQIPGLGGVEPLWDSGALPDNSTYARIELRTQFMGTVMLVDVLDADDGTADDDDSGQVAADPLDPDAVDGEIDGMIFLNSFPDYLEIGRTPCLSNWPLAEPGASTQVRFAAFDRTGAFSDWGAWTDVYIPPDYEPITPGPPGDDDDGDCSVAGRSGPGLVMLLVLLGIWGRSRD